MDTNLYNSVLSPVKSEFDAFRSYFDSLFTSSDDDMRLLLENLSKRNGKMLRPVLVLLVAKYYGISSQEIIHVASSVELLHTSTLIHDDVVDNSSLRRGLPSFNALFDNKVSVLLGDFVVALALQEMAASGNIRNVSFMSELSKTLSSGEITQLFIRSTDELSEERYIDVITRKTASLFSCCCSMAAITCGASADEIDRFGQFGTLAGTAFQIRDDIFDYFPSTETGKPSGNDLKEGKITLPLIYAITNSGSDMTEIVRAVRSCTATDEQLKYLTDFAIRCGGIEYAGQCMDKYREKALSYLPSDMSNSLRNSFEDYLSILVNRDR